MTVYLYFPHDEFDGVTGDYDLSADYVELSAFFSLDRSALISDLVNASEIGAEQDYADVEDEITRRESIISATVRRIIQRRNALGSSYPFTIDDDGTILYYLYEDINYGKAAYLLCLILSHLKAISPVLSSTSIYPTDQEIQLLRRYFQYFATAALAAEIGGQAWSFGHPRPDHTGFITKLEEIWLVLRDGAVGIGRGAPESPQDDKIDIFAARLHPDGLPGFLLAAAQVATGKNWQEKSIKAHLTAVFPQRWFARGQPVTEMVCYHIIPFPRSDDKFFDDVRVVGNLLHRLRVPYRVEEATSLIARGMPVEASDQLPEAVAWIEAYWRRGQVST